MNVIPGSPVAMRSVSAAPDDSLSQLTNHQWYYHQARQAVFYSVFSTEAETAEGLAALAADLIGKVPQIGAFYSTCNTAPLDAKVLAGIVSLEVVDALDAYPDTWDMTGDELFSRTDLPMLRIRAAVRRGGPDTAGRQSVIAVLSTHALFEGADSALLSRSLHAGHENLIGLPLRRSFVKRMAIGALGAILGATQLFIAMAVAPRTVDMVYRSYAISRARIRRLSARYRIRQRALLFALACQALYGEARAASGGKVSALFAETEARSRLSFEGEFFRHWITAGGFRMDADFPAFARLVDAEIDRIDKTDARTTQSLFNAVFGTHRLLQRWLPFLYSERIFRYSGSVDIALSITPPHRLDGPLANGIVEPIYAGTFHPGVDTCVFVPGKEHVTFNFMLREGRLADIAAVDALVRKLEEEMAQTV